MQNVEMKIEGGKGKEKLVLTVDLNQRLGLSGSGNTVVVGGSQGAVKVGVGDISLNLTVYTKEGLTKAQQDKAKAEGFASWAEYQKATKGG